MASLLAIVLAVLPAGCGPDTGRSRNFDGPWIRHTIDDTDRGADGVRVADINGDGLPDVTTGWEQSDSTRVYLHPGYDAVREPWPAVTVGRTPNVEDAVFADVDGDGDLDVVSSCEGATRKVFVSFAPDDPAELLNPAAWHTDSFPATEGVRWMYAVPMDVDGRGGIDIVIGGKREGAVVGWLESPVDGDPTDLSAWKLHAMSTAGWVMSMEAVDMNGDGLLDVLVSDRTAAEHGVRWLEQPAEPKLRRYPWDSHLVGARKRSPVFVATIPGDDGVPRGVLVPSGGERLTLFERQNVEGTRWRGHRLHYGHRLGTPKAVAVGDVNLDGELDAVLSSTNLSGLDEGVVWFERVADPHAQDWPIHGLSGAQGEKYDRIELLDLDGDGDLDVLTTEEVQQFGVIWYENPTIPGDGGDDDGRDVRPIRH